MEPDTPTSAPVVELPDAAAGPPRARSSSLLGLPARLALLTLLAIFACVAGVGWYADHRMQQSADERAGDAAATSARYVAGLFGESDFQPADDTFRRLLDTRLDEALKRDETIRGIALYAPAKGARVERIAATGTLDRRSEASTASAAFRSADESVSHVAGGDRTRVFWPVTLSDGTAAGVVALDLDARQVRASASQARTRLALGALIGAASLGLVVLLLLRRELFQPLIEMRRVMTQIRGGATGVRIGWDRGDELGAVAADFDDMVAELEAAHAELARYVNRDPLTGLLTAEAFTERFGGELTRARREGYPIALLSIDVDELDAINRTHDRDAGDRVLADLGRVIDSCTRPTDSCGRTGGDSFQVALIGADAARAGVVVERIRREVAQRVGIGPERTRVTCGYGLAEFPTHAVDQLALERMSTSACEHAQRQGRDRAVAFGPSGGYVDIASLVADVGGPEVVPRGTRELESTVHALARSLDVLDERVGGAHAQRVARYAVAVARELGCDETHVRELRTAAVLHDVGKVAVRPELLRRAEASLDDLERRELGRHADVARTIIAAAGLANVADVVAGMTRPWRDADDPSGAVQPPLSSRILRAAEQLDLSTAFDGANVEAAVAWLERESGTSLDPEVASTLARLVLDGLVFDAGARRERDSAKADAEAA